MMLRGRGLSWSCTIFSNIRPITRGNGRMGCLMALGELYTMMDLCTRDASTKVLRIATRLFSSERTAVSTEGRSDKIRPMVKASSQLPNVFTRANF